MKRNTAKPPDGSQAKITLKFWGTRGSIPTPGPATLKYGGNTSCLEVRMDGDYVLIFDAGTGIRALGNFLIKNKAPVKAHIFLTHFHWDHIQGLPFFAPAYIAGNHFTIYGCEDSDKKLRRIISDQMDSAYFPVPLRKLGADIVFRPLDQGSFKIENFIIDTMYLNHPGKTLGYRLTFQKRKIAYLTDNELRVDERRKGQENSDKFIADNLEFVTFAKGVDFLIMDSAYTREEYNEKRGWGHSCYQDVLEVALAAQAKQLILFHHAPQQTDKVVAKKVQHCRQIIRDRGADLKCLAAQEGMVLKL